mmetsp:Transcript_65425/g.116452  ORF Transcript_65425/g.116452 Transcript_65425/m.116452 type:complete len:196 (-) Transcript_65425:972-1559(-)
MLKFTLISRCADALPLAASMDNTVDSSFADPDKYKLQAKNIFKELSLNPPPRLLTITSGEYSFHLLTDQGVSYLTLCESKAPSYLAFAFLEDLHKEFQTLYGTELGKTERPYAFIKFDTFLQKTKKVYQDTRQKSNLSKLQGKFNPVKKSISDVLGWVKEDPVSQAVEMPPPAVLAGGGIALLILILMVMVYFFR